MIENIIIDGTERRTGTATRDRLRYLIVIDGKAVWLPYSLFILIRKCCIAAKNGYWLAPKAIEVCGNQQRYTYLLKKEIEKQIGHNHVPSFTQKVHKGRKRAKGDHSWYQIKIDPDNIIIHKRALQW